MEQTTATGPDGFELRANPNYRTVFVFKDGQEVGWFWPVAVTGRYSAFLRGGTGQPIARPKTPKGCILKITGGEWDGTPVEPVAIPVEGA